VPPRVCGAPDQAVSIPTLPTKTALDTADEQTEQFLIQYGLNRLLAEHLEARLKQTPPTPGQISPRRSELADRLAETYARILSNTDDLGEQARVEAKARELLASVPEADSVELRLGLARAGYARLEQIAERRRVRSASQSDAVSAASRLDELARQFESIASDANGRVQSLERQESSTTSDQNLVATALAGVRAQRSQGHYLAGWCLYYAHELEPAGRDDYPVRALRHLGWLLGVARPDSDPLDAAKAPTDFLKFEHVARAAVAAGLCLSQQGRCDEALRWFDTVEKSADAPEVVKSQVPARRMVVLARCGRWDSLKSFVLKRREPPVVQIGQTAPAFVPLDPGEARLLAVLALQADAASAGAQEMIQLGVSDLLARGEPGPVLELASEFGVDRFASTGFIGHQVRALQLYDQAKKAHGAAGASEGAGGPQGEPSRDPEACRLFRAAGEQFRLALDAPDRAAFPGALGNTRMLLGLCAFNASGAAPPGGSEREAISELARAAEWFDGAYAALAEPARKSEAMWMAIRSMDLYLARAATPEHDAPARRDELIDRYIKAFPDGERTSALLVRRAASKAKASPEEVARLLGVPESDGQYLSSRRQAARMSFELYRAAPPGSGKRDALGMKYVEIAEPLLASERRRAGEDPVAAANASAHARQMLDVLLSSANPDAARAERILDVLKSLIASKLVDQGPIAGEILMRRMQLALARGQTDAAAQLLEEVRAKDEKLAQVGDRLVLVFQQREFVSARAALEREPSEASKARAVAAARTALTTARRLLKTEGDGGSRLSDQASVSLNASAAEAGAFLWNSASDASARDLALALYRVLARKLPDTRSVVRGLAEMSLAAGEWAEAREAWSTLASAAEPGSVPMFEARYHLISATARLSHDEAVELFRQHAALYPALGPPPWGEKFRVLARELGVSPPAGGAP